MADIGSSMHDWVDEDGLKEWLGKIIECEQVTCEELEAGDLGRSKRLLVGTELGRGGNHIVLDTRKEDMQPYYVRHNCQLSKVQLTLYNGGQVVGSVEATRWQDWSGLESDPVQAFCFITKFQGTGPDLQSRLLRLLCCCLSERHVWTVGVLTTDPGLLTAFIRVFRCQGVEDEYAFYYRSDTLQARHWLRDQVDEMIKVAPVQDLHELVYGGDYGGTLNIMLQLAHTGDAERYMDLTAGRSSGTGLDRRAVKLPPDCRWLVTAVYPPEWKSSRTTVVPENKLQASPLTLDLVSARHRHLNDCKLQPGENFLAFCSEFEGRFLAYTSTSKLHAMNDATKCTVFMSALDDRFTEWATTTSSSHCIEGVGTGRKMSFLELRNSAYDKWCNLELSGAQLTRWQDEEGKRMAVARKARKKARKKAWREERERREAMEMRASISF